MIKIINKINETVGRFVSWFTTALVLFVCFDVIRRYIFKDSAAWVMELEWHLFSIIFLLGAAYTFKHNQHVRVDLFYEKFSPLDRAKVNFVGILVFLIPWCLVIIYVSMHYALSSFAIKEGSPDPGGLPARYIIKFCIPLGFFLLLLQGIAALAESWNIIQNKATK